MSQSGTIRQVILPGVVEPDGLVVSERPMPDPQRGQARIRMLASGVSFAENSMRRNRYPGQPRFPFVPGYDLVGEVTAVGAGVTPALLGKRIAAVTKTGAWASEVVLDARDLMPLSAGADPAVVETVLLNGITAWQMLHGAARFDPHATAAGAEDGRGTVLVHGASGGVGSLLVQMARRAGLSVIGTASSRNHDRVRALGAEPVDYGDAQLDARLSQLAPAGFDAVFDNIGGASFAQSFAHLAPGGTLVGYGTNSQREEIGNQILAFAAILSRFALWSLAPNRGRRATFYNFWAGQSLTATRFRARMRQDLDSVLALVRSGALETTIAASFPLERASEALALADTRSLAGKVIIEG